MRTCVIPPGLFHFGLHKPSYQVRNLRSRSRHESLGKDQRDTTIDNSDNFPSGDIKVDEADWIYEIANPFPFRGTTYIGKSWADRACEDIDSIRLPEAPELSLTKLLEDRRLPVSFIDALPRPLLLALATTSTDPLDLIRLAQKSCSFIMRDSEPVGLHFQEAADGRVRPEISDHLLFEAIANNPALPDSYKIAMVLRPGAQGNSEIVGDFHTGETHIHEYLRTNSYIGGGHYAANMAEDAIRYRIADLSRGDMEGLRHLYYQRTYCRLADLLAIPYHSNLDAAGLETLRQKIAKHPDLSDLAYGATIWGWNFGFDYAPSGYRLHASHQQVHQQYALVPAAIACCSGDEHSSAGYQSSFACGDMIEETIESYRALHGREFFEDYLQAIMGNRRMDGRKDREASLIVWQDEHVVLFVPKAQTSQWELQLMTRPLPGGTWPGSIIETDDSTRASLDTALLKAQLALARRGARLVSSIEFSKRFTSSQQAQPLIYSLLPKMPESPGAFSEAQLRFINGHYPEDFAAACRQSLG